MDLRDEGIDADVKVIGVPNVLAVSSEMSDDVAYAITRAMFENIADLKQKVVETQARLGVSFDGDADDFERYPRDTEADLSIYADEGVDDVQVTDYRIVEGD